MANEPLHRSMLELKTRLLAMESRCDDLRRLNNQYLTSAEEKDERIRQLDLRVQRLQRTLSRRAVRQRQLELI